MARPAPPATQRCWRPTGDAARWHSNRAARTRTTKQLKGQRLVSRLAPVQTIQAEQPFPLEYCLECIGGPPGRSEERRVGKVGRTARPDRRWAGRGGAE